MTNDLIRFMPSLLEAIVVYNNYLSILCSMAHHQKTSNVVKLPTAAAN